MVVYSARNVDINIKTVCGVRVKHAQKEIATQLEEQWCILDFGLPNIYAKRWWRLHIKSNNCALSIPSGYLEMPSMPTSPSQIAIDPAFVLWFFNCCDPCNVLQGRPTHGIKYIISSIHHRETWHPKVTIRRESSPCTDPSSYSSCPCIILLSSSNAIDSK